MHSLHLQHQRHFFQGFETLNPLCLWRNIFSQRYGFAISESNFGNSGTYRKTQVWLKSAYPNLSMNWIKKLRLQSQLTNSSHRMPDVHRTHTRSVHHEFWFLRVDSLWETPCRKSFNQLKGWYSKSIRYVIRVSLEQERSIAWEK